MGRQGSGVLRTSLSALHFSGVDSLATSLTRGSGAVFTLHHVLPAAPMVFAPNRHLEVTPEFLEHVVRLVLDRGYDVISLDDACARFAESEFDRPFVCFTFDGGYRDTLRHAYPIFRRHALPFAVYVTSDFADGIGDLWWLALERLIRRVSTIELRIDGVLRSFTCRRASTKARAYHTIHRWLKKLPETDARAIVAGLCREHGFDVSGLCREMAMDWDEVRELARDPLVTIGAHTRSHLPLARLSLAEARFEIETSIARVERELGRPCRHFSFPYGDEQSVSAREYALAREAGVATAVTARKGPLRPRDGLAMTALPRLSLSGDLQKSRYVKVMLSGAPYALGSLAAWLRPRIAPVGATA